MVQKAEETILPIGKKGHRNNYHNAFTLIELVLITLIISILIGLSTPLFRRSFSDLTLKDSSYTISKLINYGQEKAILERKNFKMNFDFQSGKYWLLEWDDLLDPPTYKRIAGKLGRVFTLPRGISFRGSKNEVVFYPDGHSDEGNIDIFNAKGEGYRITIKGFGSRVEIKEVKGEG